MTDAPGMNGFAFEIKAAAQVLREENSRDSVLGALGVWLECVAAEFSAGVRISAPSLPIEIARRVMKDAE